MFRYMLCLCDLWIPLTLFPSLQRRQGLYREHSLTSVRLTQQKVVKLGQVGGGGMVAGSAQGLA